MSSPTEPKTVIDLLRARAGQKGEQIYLRYLITGDPDGPQEVRSFGQVERRARAIAARLLSLGLRGQRVILLQPPGPAFLETILGCFFAGAIAVPVALPDPARIARAAARLRAIVDDTLPAAVLAAAEVTPFLAVLGAEAGIARLPVFLPSDAGDEEAERWPEQGIAADDVALLQYTSGSTGTPRGVVLTHGNLLANLAAIATSFGKDPPVVTVSWLPPYHDMGLIGGLFGPMSMGFTTVAMSPLAFLQRPMRWMEAVSAFRADVTVGPDFALALLPRRATDEEIGRLDLSCLRVCLCGAEPVRAATLRRFQERFAPAGLRPGVVRPCYGLAEATLMVSCSGPAGAAVLRVSADALHAGRLRRDETGGKELVGSGAVVADTEVIAVDPETRLSCPPGVVGELWIRGPGVARGYFGHGGRGGDGEDTDSFGARLATGDGPFLRSGDLGVVDEGAGVIVCGRHKDLIIVRGRNLHPNDIEATVEAAEAAVRPGCAVAFPVTDEEGQERLGLAVEVRPEYPASGAAALCEHLREAVVGAHEVDPALIALLPKGELPKTTSGKIQRRATREALLSGKLSVLAEIRTAPEPIYVGLPARVARLDARGTGYQFDLIRDVDWRIEQPGEFLPPTLARDFLGEAYDAACAAGAWQDVEWLLAMAISRTFVHSEKLLVEFIRCEREPLGPHRSLDLFLEEEDKHMALFQRLGEALEERRPELARALDVHFAPLAVEQARWMTRADYPSRAAWHFGVWAQTLFFECWTLWLAERLRAEPERVQPTWHSAHLMHAREEAQHVATDRAWLGCHSAGSGENDPWARSLLMRFLAGPVATLRTALLAAQDLHPGLSLAGLITVANILDILPERTFRPCREQLPFFGELATATAGVQGRLVRAVHGAAPHRDLDEILGYIRGWVARVKGRPASSIPEDVTFARLGLDSMDHIGLAADLGGFLCADVSEVAVYTCPTPRLLATALLHAGAGADPTVTSATGNPASARQARLFKRDAALGGTLQAPLSTAWRLEGTVSAEALGAALLDVVQRHEGLRTSFALAGPLVVQHVGPPAPVALEVIDVHDVDDPDGTARAVAARFEMTPYALATGPLFRAALVRSRRSAVVMLGLHHIIADGWSLAVLAEDLATAYGARLTGHAPSWEALSTTPQRLAAAESTLVDGPEGARRLSWWRKWLFGHPALGHSFRTTDVQVRAVWRWIDGARRAAWTAWAEAHGDTLAGLVLAALHLELLRREGLSDVLLCAHIHDRPSEELRRLVGFLVNVLPLRTDLTGATDLQEVLLRVRRSWVEAVAHELPIDALVQALAPERHATRFMPSPVAFNFIPPGPEQCGGPAVVWRHAPGLLPVPSFLNFERMFVARIAGDGLWLGAWCEEDALAPAQVVLDGILAALP